MADLPPAPDRPRQNGMTMTPSTPDSTRAALDHASGHLYDAECAAHCARQSGVDQWIAAANDHLHQAVLEYLTAQRATSAGGSSTQA